MCKQVAVLGLFLLVLTGSAQAAGRLVLLQPAGPPTLALQGALQRISAELRLEGYEPQMQPFTPVAPSVEAVEADATQLRAFGVLVLLHLPEAHAVRVLSFDGKRSTWVQRTLPLEEDGDAASVLSIRAVEIMRAHFLERRYKPVVIERPATTAAVVASLSPHTWSLGAGLASLVDAGPQAVLAPHLGAAWSFRQWSVKLSVVPTTTSFDAQDVVGVAKASQQAAWMSAAYHLGSRSRAVIPYVGANVGAARLQAQGSAQAPYRGVNPSYVTALLGAGAGCVWWATQHWGLSLSADVLWFASAASLQIDNDEQRRLGQPQFVASLGGVFSWGQGQ